MRENKYDNSDFFEKYSQMARSNEGLSGAGEWHELKKLLPPFQGKRVLDLGCGYGWHCIYAAEQGAKEVLGVDSSEKMLAVAREKTHLSQVRYLKKPIEEFLPEDSYDIVLSSLVLHYVASFSAVCKVVADCLIPGGSFVFSVEHPIFTAYGSQDWYYGQDGEKLHWPVDRYFTEGWREAIFLGEPIIKYHRTLTTYLNVLLQSGFEIKAMVEPTPDPKLMDRMPGLEEELRRSMMLLISAVKK